METGTAGLRILLTPRISVEHAGGLVDEELLPGRQGRVAFAFLVLERARPVSRDELASVLWPDELPASWEASLSAVVSKVRAFLTKAGLGAESLTSAVGCYQLRLPPSSFIDVEAAIDGVHRLETLIRNDALAEAWGMSSVPYFIAKRPFLPGAEGPWVERVRARMREVFLKSADLRSGVFLWNKEFEHAIRMAEDAIALDPFRESAYRRLMQAYRASGSRADAIRAYERCSEILNRELGIEPSAETKALHDEVRGGDGKSRTPDERVFATILFTDIVSSSPRSSSLGDRRWRDVLDRHDAIIHEQLDRFGGKLIKTTGDGILATFEAPARAVICARHIEEAMGALDIQIRVGLHAGEVEQRSEDVSGIAVVIARRVCDTGDAGDVLVSRTLVDLVAGAGIDFVDRGEHELKGVPGHWQLFALRPTPS